MELANESGDRTAVTSLVLLLVTFVALYLVLQRKKLPPGPFAFPVVGSFPALAGDLPHRALQNLAFKYGGLMYLRLGSVPTVVVSTAAIAEELFQKHDGNFLDRPKTMAHYILTDKLHMNPVSSSGSYWRQLRKFYTSELFTARRQASYQGIRRDEIKTSIREIAADSEQGKPINIKDWLQGVTSNNMTRMLVNKRYFGRGNNNIKEKEEFQFMIRRLFDMLGAFIISDYVPYLGFVSKLQGWEKKFEELRVLMRDIMERVFEIQKHKQLAKERVDDGSFAPDFVDVLLQKPFQDGKPLPDKNISWLVTDMLNAGTETIATAVEWAVAEVVTRPDVMQRLQHELDTVVGTDRLVQESDLPNLPFLQAVVKETFRLHPPLPLNLPREATHAFEFRGYKFPKQTRLLLNIFAIHRDPSVYEDQDEFKPERFLTRPEVNHLSGFDSYELIPFSVGRRMCPAFNLGNVMVTPTLAHLMHCFDWSLANGESLEMVDMSEVFGLAVSMKTPLLLIASPRLPASLY